MIDIKNVTPQKDIVIVKVTQLQEIFDGLSMPTLSDENDIAIRYGEVISIGPLVQELHHCPGLKPGEISVFTEFAGHYIPTKEDLYKAIRGYDVIGKFTTEMETKNKKNLIPTGDRVMVEVLDISKLTDGLVMNAKDPRLSELEFGKILKVNQTHNRQKYKEGQLVAFPTYAGTIVRHYESDEDPELKVIVEFDILFTL